MIQYAFSAVCQIFVALTNLLYKRWMPQEVAGCPTPLYYPGLPYSPAFAPIQCARPAYQVTRLTTKQSSQTSNPLTTKQSSQTTTPRA